MKYVYLSILIVAVGFLLSCNNPGPPKADSNTGSDLQTIQTESLVQPPSTDSFAAPSNQAVTLPVTTPPAATAQGLNPPHGQPNHRCDIPVGAPLNSPPGKTPVSGETKKPVVATPKQQLNPTPAVTQTAPGMNPPHGQPNHRCDIPVGAPLDSPPGKKTDAAKPQETPVKQEAAPAVQPK
ncbi:MAG: hypothetical protein AB9842_11520 [Bacteroidales bacterium]